MNRAQIATALRPGVKRIMQAPSPLPPQYQEIFDKDTSDRAEEIELEFKFLGPASEKKEGFGVAQGSMGERFKTIYRHKTYGIAITITKEALEDNLYKDKLPMVNRSLRHSMDTTKDIVAASVLNLGWTRLIADRQPFFSLNHPIDGGVSANTFSAPVDLNETSLEAALMGVRRFKDQSGMLAKARGRKLIVGVNNEFAAIRLLHTAGRVGTPNHDINAIKFSGAIPQGYAVNDYITFPNAWFLKTNQEGLRYYERTPIEVDSHVDPATKSIIYDVMQRYSFDTSTFKTMFASQGPT